MKYFKMSEQQLIQVGTALGECPSKYVFSAIEILRKLEEIPEIESSKVEEIKQ